jgi:dinuclear metal center YbgI/SA1388 family protein
MELSQVVKALNKFAPTSYAGSWDNVGLLIEPLDNKPIKKILLTNDLTEPVMDEAISQGSDMILSYHPPIFRPFKRLTSKNWKERIVLRCTQHGIALYSPHTSWDAIKGGINEWLLLPFGKLTDVNPCEQEYDSSSHKFIVNSSINNSGESAQMMTKQEIIQALDNKSLGEEVSIVKQEARPIPGIGPGRVAKLENHISLKEAIDRVKSHLCLPHIRFALANGASLDAEGGVTSVGVCAGSGGSVLAAVQADLILTGEMSHHEVLDFVHRGVSVILTDHSNTERGFHSYIREDLVKTLDNKVEILVSKVDRDPLQVI